MFYFLFGQHTIVVVSFSQSRTPRDEWETKKRRFLSHKHDNSSSPPKIKKEKRTRVCSRDLFWERERGRDRELWCKTFIKLLMHHHSCKSGPLVYPFCLNSPLNISSLKETLGSCVCFFASIWFDPNSVLNVCWANWFIIGGDD